MEASEEVKQSINRTSLLHLLQQDKELNFLFRTGYIKQFRLQGHQLPLKASFTEKHKRTLQDIPMLFLIDGDKIHCMVAPVISTSMERKEYLIKRALDDLCEIYEWRKVCVNTDI